MSKKLRIVIAQLNFVVGDIQGNLQKHIQAARKARDELHADVIIFPELSMIGYAAEDLLLRPAFIEEAEQAIRTFKTKVKNIYCLVGHPYATRKGLYNAASLIYNGKVLNRYAKQCLPNYGVFDEKRYFISGNKSGIVSIRNIPIGIVICEDLWHTKPIPETAKQGARLILSPNASPFEINKQKQRQQVLAKRAKAANIPIIYANLIGGQDDLVFDGGSMAVDADGRVCQHAGFFKENLLAVDVDFTAEDVKIQSTEFTLPSEEEKIYQCLVLGVRDYIQKNNLPGALIGVSGGIDSALTLAIAVDALGKDRVKAIVMPSRYTSDISLEDANTLINNFMIARETISIEPAFKSFLTLLAPVLKKRKADTTEENIQARCRGLIIMALANNSGTIVLNTSNHSEMAVGYSTLYGDMVGGFAVLKDVPKTLIYRLANYRNSIAAVIPQRIIDRAPTAELKFNQTDQDSLPPYAILDEILALYLNQQKSVADIIAAGYEEEIVEKVIRLIKLNEYKRRQAPVGIRIDHKAFARDRRYPITSGFKN
jgi:NAD+ synthase (glutamine-hydrolysing)